MSNPEVGINFMGPPLQQSSQGARAAVVLTLYPTKESYANLSARGMDVNLFRLNCANETPAITPSSL